MFALFCLGQRTNFLPDTTGACISDSVYISLPNSVDKKAKITWITPTNIEYNTKKINVNKRTGKYIVIVTEGNKTLKDSTIVVFAKKPIFNVPDTVICKGNSITLDTKNTNYTYTWSNKQTGNKAKYETSGKHWVTASNNGCLHTDTFKIKQIQGVQTSFQNEITFCLSEEQKNLSVKGPAGTRYLWNNGSTSNSLNVNKEGMYWVKTESKTCGTRYDSVSVKLKACDCEMLIPNSFTPNEDNKNDYFFPVLQCEYSSYSFTIFDKWGNQIFTTNSTNGKWDGRFKGNLCEEDIYVYKIESTEKITEKKVNRSGRISLIR